MYPFNSRVFVAPGAGGMAHEGYPYHGVPPFSFNRGWHMRDDVVFQTKGISAFACEGNMPLKSDGVTPEEFFPRCIIMSFLTGHSINAVGFSNFGIDFYVLKGIFDFMKGEWIFNFMPLRETEQKREAEAVHFARFLKRHWSRFKVKPKIGMNHGCPNVSSKATAVSEFKQHHDIVRNELEFEIEIYDNFSVVAPVPILVETASFSSGLFIANTVPHSRMVEDGKSFPWGEVSPLIKRGFDKEGGWSGNRCRDYALETGAAVRAQDKNILLIGGNGIQAESHVDEFTADFDGIQVGMAPIFKPFPGLMDSIVNRANFLKWRTS